jgi:hypothetical protein
MNNSKIRYVCNKVGQVGAGERAEFDMQFLRYVWRTDRIKCEFFGSFGVPSFQKYCRAITEILNFNRTG